jgi:hypothetical protein
MKLQNHTLVALAIGAALAAPVALAQNANANTNAGANAGAQVQGAANAQVPDPVPAADRAVERTSGAVQDATQSATQATQSAQDKMQDSTTAQTDDTDDAKDADDTQDAPPAPPTQSQGAANAAAHASVTQRDLWNRLDTDKDGMISATEADADADFDGRFAAMDSDGDGSISDSEYTTYAKTNLATSGEHAATHSQAGITSVWSNFDQDDDGKLSAAEVEADANLKGSFADMDGDADGFVTQDEYRDYAMVNRKPAEPESP